jgi:hypothetical protein
MAPTKGDLRRARKEAQAAGCDWHIEIDPATGGLTQTRTRTSRQESRHAKRMAHWATRYLDSEGAGEPDDR